MLDNRDGVAVYLGDHDYRPLSCKNDRRAERITLSIHNPTAHGIIVFAHIRNVRKQRTSGENVACNSYLPGDSLSVFD
jgi:hypothetical protein